MLIDYTEPDKDVEDIHGTDLASILGIKKTFTILIWLRFWVSKRTAKIFFRYQYSRPGLSKPSHPPLLHIQNESGQVDLPNHFIVSCLGQIRRSIIKNLANPNVLELGLNIMFFFMCIYLEYKLILALTFYLFIYYQQECVKMVDADVSRHKHCTEEYFDYWRCVEKCVVPKLFEKLTYWKENSKAGVIKP
ncbi:hypothetical protein LXL04_020629 [Taraxacum kok-saghyz]